MKILIFLSIFFMFNTYALDQEDEGDLQIPVSNASEMTRQEEQETPTLEEVEMIQKKTIEQKKSAKKTTTTKKERY